MEWNGAKWIEHPLPAEIAGKSSIDEWLADDRDRGWLFFSSGSVAICKFDDAQWQVFDTVERALEAQPREGVRLRNLDHPFLSPVFSGDGRCALFELSDRLSYFDGTAWRHWSRREIGGEDVQVNGEPFFDEAKQLCFPLSGRTYQWDPTAAKWISFDAPLRPEPSTRPVEEQVEISEPSPVRNPASVARDSFGTYWLTTREGQLKKLAPGVMVSAFYDGEPHPFQDGLKVYRALIDARGAAWLETSNFGPYHSYVFIPALEQPETKAELLRVEADTAVLRFTSPIGDSPQTRGPTSTVLFSYRLDGGKWQRLTQEPDLTLTRLAAGRHRLLARAYAPDLTPDPTPAVVEWETRINPEQQWRALLVELSAPDLSRREAAAKAFREQGAAALPFLKKARETASEELRWWIDAILQQVQARR